MWQKVQLKNNIRWESKKWSIWKLSMWMIPSGVFYALPLWGSCLGRDPNTVLPHYCFFFMLVLIIYSFYLIKKAFAASYIVLEPSTRHHWLHTACYHCSDSEDQVWCHRAEPRLVLTSFHLQYAKLLCCEEPSLWNLHHPTQTSYSLGLGPGQLWADDTCQPFRQCSQLQLYYCPQAHLWSSKWREKSQNGKKIAYLGRKNEILNKVRHGMSSALTGRQYGLNKSSVHGIKRREKDIKDALALSMGVSATK